MKKQRAFTLIELMVVMAIVALLLSIAAPRYFNHLERAREATLRQSLAVMRDAIDKFHGDTSAYPETLEDLAVKRYLRAVPVDPLTDSAETWVIVPPPPANGAGRVWDVKSGAEGNGLDGSAYSEW
ncbi:type IV pilin protein [Rhodocyclus tenuis]|uniref:General secretion pathway protein G n=1 Tax=Rhodocyclus tenuis TaxID=1066 RepID=A0A840GIN4_RHOTE|nr:type II secretion system protein [Rhodocyclus tenuis]MBB4248322.1 general secretion pathway protein G [Rhodocyclus tenuis]